MGGSVRTTTEALWHARGQLPSEPGLPQPFDSADRPAGGGPQANQPGYDPIQTERRFERAQTDVTPSGRPRLPKAQFSNPEGRGNTKPMFVLRRVSIVGATAIPRDRLVTAYQTYLGKEVSEADLIAMAAAVSDVYRAAGFHLSRAMTRRTSRTASYAFKSLRAASPTWC